MSFIKNLRADLVEKRLWPVALVLLLALIAVPVTLGGANDDAGLRSVPRGATGTTGAAGLTAQVSLEQISPVRRDRAGKERDPFKQSGSVATAMGATGISAPPLTKTPSDGGGSAGGTGIDAPPLTKTPSTGGGSADNSPADSTPSDPPSTPTTPTTPDQTPPTPPKQTPPAPDPLDSYTATLVLGETGTKRDRKTVERLAPLPSATNPFLVYVGVLPDKKTAVFLVSADVKATGEGACKPRTSSCETVELRHGDTEYFALTGEDGKVTWYQLDFGHITKKDDTPSPATAARARSRPKAAAKASASDDLGSDGYSYDEATGLLRRVKGSAGAPAEEPSGDGVISTILRGFEAAKEPVASPGFLP